MAPGGQVIHIFSHSGSATEEVEAQLADLGVTSHHSSDCYVGLASLVCRGADEYDCVLVSLESLSGSDAEFFQIVRRRFRPLPIYVYGVGAGEISTSWAVRIGARGCIDTSLLRSMFKDLRTAETALSRSPGPELSPRLTDLLVDEIVRPIEGEQAQKKDAGIEPQPLETGSEFRAEEISARREETQNWRQRPPTQSRPHQGGTHAPADQPPLLSDEELRALLGDDPLLDEDADVKGMSEEGS